MINVLRFISEFWSKIQKFDAVNAEGSIPHHRFIYLLLNY
ncbi:hypothetical protein HDC92_002163 [Pedobacter sp. AK017]|nr:hypothetical protein [Pedobacter sp. AK017]